MADSCSYKKEGIELFEIRPPLIYKVVKFPPISDKFKTVLLENDDNDDNNNDIFKNQIREIPRTFLSNISIKNEMILSPDSKSYFVIKSALIFAYNNHVSFIPFCTKSQQQKSIYDVQLVFYFDNASAHGYRIDESEVVQVGIDDILRSQSYYILLTTDHTDSTLLYHRYIEFLKNNKIVSFQKNILKLIITCGLTTTSHTGTDDFEPHSGSASEYFAKFLNEFLEPKFHLKLENCKTPSLFHHEICKNFQKRHTK